MNEEEELKQEMYEEDVRLAYFETLEELSKKILKLEDLLKGVMQHCNPAVSDLEEACVFLNHPIQSNYRCFCREVMKKHKHEWQYYPPDIDVNAITVCLLCGKVKKK